jgi:hypothetical protein
MTTYSVIRKSDGVHVYSYNADTPIEWSGMEFATHDHVAQPEITPEGDIVGVVVGRVYSQVEWLRRFTTAERIAIRQAASANPVLDDYIRLMDATMEIHTDDPDTIAGVQTLEAVGLLAEGRAAEILA